MTTIAVTSGKVGAGTTCVVANLGVALAKLGHRVVVVDAGGAQAGVSHWLRLPVARTPDGLFPGLTGLGGAPEAGAFGCVVVSRPRRHGMFTRNGSRELAADITRLQSAVDYVLVDMGSGTPAVVTALNPDLVFVVTLPHSRHIDAASQVVHTLACNGGHGDVNLVLNQVQRGSWRKRAYGVLHRAAFGFLRRSIGCAGVIPDDPEVRRAFMKRRAVVDCCPNAPASRRFLEMAIRLSGRGPTTWAALCRRRYTRVTSWTPEMLQCA
jgi:flagellar biosynthesis protein FlhG